MEFAFDLRFCFHAGHLQNPLHILSIFPFFLSCLLYTDLLETKKLGMNLPNFTSMNMSKLFAKSA